MVEIKHIPEKLNENCYRISGDNIEELVEYCLQRIRQRSKEYYRNELLNNLNHKGSSFIDVHAGMGNVYTVELTGENGCRARATRFLLSHNYACEAIERFIETNWQWVLSDEQNMAKFENWLKIVYPQCLTEKISDKLLNPKTFTYPQYFRFCLPVSDHQFWYCQFDRSQLIYIPNSIEHRWFRHYKEQPSQLLNDAKENKALKMFIDAHKLWISATIDVNNIPSQDVESLFITNGRQKEDYREGHERNQIITEMYFETHLNEFRKS